MLTVNHVPVGALVGLVARNHPLIALGLGVASHIALDSVSHWGTASDNYEHYIYVARRDGVAGLATSALLLCAAPRSARLAVAAGIVGSVAPDFDQVTQYFFKRTIYPAGFRKIHGNVQRESTTLMRQELTRAALSPTAALCALYISSRPRQQKLA